MKVILDLDKLLQDHKITKLEYQKLLELGHQETNALGFSILLSFGVIAVSGSTIALVPSALTAILLGLGIAAIGLIPLRSRPRWELLAQILSLIGSLLVCGGLLWLYSFHTIAWIVVTLLLAFVSILATNGLLAVLSILSLSAAVGAGTGYSEASYFVMINSPFVTILLFSGLAILFYLASIKLPNPYSHLSLLASRTSVFLANVGFWVGSLWGETFPNGTTLNDLVFVFVWALLLIITGAWSVYANKRWLLNVCAVFAGIHFYTQWFERLGATPLSVLIAGLIALFFVVLLGQLNIHYFKKKHSSN